MAILDSTLESTTRLANGVAKTLADSVGASTANGRSSEPVASTSYLPASSALKHLATYPKSDGLSLQDLMDSDKHGGLTCASQHGSWTR